MIKGIVIAVDFDGTLCTNEYPKIGSPNDLLIKRLISLRNKGVKLILWTCRVGEPLENAVSWCHYKGLDFDAVNSNLPEHVLKYGDDCRKVFADYYIDDRASSPLMFMGISNSWVKGSKRR